MTKFHYPKHIKESIQKYMKENDLNMTGFINLKAISKPTYYKIINEETRRIKDSTIKGLKKIGVL